jgi:hypothetical protein
MFGGDNFGRQGIRPNLAETDGFVAAAEGGGPPLRTLHMTMLARSCVRGFAL